MDALIIEATEFTPRVSFDPETRSIEFSGVSRPENVTEFYGQVLDWMTGYESELYKNNVLGGKKFDVNVTFNFSYFNSSSAKMIYQLLECLVRLKNMGYVINVSWHYEDGDDQMHDDGEELSEAIDIPFNFEVN
jgi:Domain of unknown function (DUF1987).